MHPQAMDWVKKFGSSRRLSVLDIGGRNINGTAHDAWSQADPYTVLDIRPGEGVDIVADAADWTPDRQYDVVVCAEVFEHAARWREIVPVMYAACRPGGMAVLTMAGKGRLPHSAIDGCQVRDGEYYGNVRYQELKAELELSGFQSVEVNYSDEHCDLRAVAYRPDRCTELDENGVGVGHCPCYCHLTDRYPTAHLGSFGKCPDTCFTVWERISRELDSQRRDYERLAHSSPLS